jgi:hypothetical protein
MLRILCKRIDRDEIVNVRKFVPLLLYGLNAKRSRDSARFRSFCDALETDEEDRTPKYSSERLIPVVNDFVTCSCMSEFIEHPPANRKWNERS